MPDLDSLRHSASQDRHHFDLAIVGGGQAALATAWFLRRTGLSFVLLDAEEGPGGVWRHGWDSLRLFSPAKWSSIAGWLMPTRTGYPRSGNRAADGWFGRYRDGGAGAGGALGSVRPFVRFTDDGVEWSDGSREAIDAVIWCTGYRPALGHLRPLDIIDADGRVEVQGTRSVRQPLLWLVGYGDWTGPASATLVGVTRTARNTVAEISAALSDASTPTVAGHLE